MHNLQKGAAAATHSAPAPLRGFRSRNGGGRKEKGQVSETKYEKEPGIKRGRSAHE